MKINDIAGIIRKSRVIDLFESGDGTQWVGTDKVQYPLYGLPLLDETSLPVLLSIPEKDRGKYTIHHISCPEDYNYSDSDGFERPIPYAGLVSIGYGGMVIYPARSSLGLKFYDPELVKPIKTSHELFERETKDGEIYLAVKVGLMLMALIKPLKLNEADMANRLHRMYKEMITGCSREKLPNGQNKYIIDRETGEVLETEYGD